MPVPALTEPLAIYDGREPVPACFDVGPGIAAVYANVCPEKTTANEDALAVIPCGQNRAVLAVADGFGGQPAGDQAARLAIDAVVLAVTECLRQERELREGILNGFEQANIAVTDLGVGAATTLAVTEIDAGVVRSYHVGDSEILIVGNKGKVKLQTVSHSPVGYGVEAGLIDRDDALHHEERNLVSNMVGSTEMRIDIGPHISLRPRDTLLLASDGLFDNLSAEEIVDIIRKGKLLHSCKQLLSACNARMNNPEPGAPGKPDDLALLLFRLNP